MADENKANEVTEEQLNSAMWGGLMVIPAGQQRVVSVSDLAAERRDEEARSAASAQAQIEAHAEQAAQEAERAKEWKEKLNGE